MAHAKEGLRRRSLLPELWALLKPRRGLFLLAAGLLIVNRISGFALPLGIKYLVDTVLRRGQLQSLTPIVLGILFATALQGLTTFAVTRLLSSAGQRLICELRVRLHQHILRLPVPFHDANRSGSLVSRIMSDLESLRNLFGTGLFDLAGGGLTAAIATVLLFRTSPKITAVVLLLFVCFAAGLRGRSRTLRPLFRRRSQILSEVTGRLAESLAGVRVVKSYRAEEREGAVFAAGARRICENSVELQYKQSLLSVFSATLSGIAGALVMWMGAREIAAGRMQIGDLIMYSALLALVAGPVVQSVGLAGQVSEAMAALERTLQLLGERPEDEEAGRRLPMPSIAGHVQFEKVSFAYRAGNPVLHELSFEARPGSVTAFVGSSGSGKSTTASLIAAFHSPTEGKVLVDGVDLKRAELASYRSQLAVVFQDSFLFDGTLWENVAFSNPGASEDRIRAACRLAQVDEFASKLPEGYRTIVGERGVKLSGGQKQRVSFARAILADAPLLILDEATSSLDSESEAQIQAGMAHLTRGRTTFVIAHRLSTIRSADQILVLDKGRLVERGNHTQLLAARGRYHDLYMRQHAAHSDLFLFPDEQEAAA